MLINDNKGSYGMFSRTGRNTADKFHILMKKDEILNGTARKFKPPDLFSKAQDEANKYHSDNLQHLQQVFLDDHIEHNKQKESKKKISAGITRQMLLANTEELGMTVE